jgi:flagellar biogenesis protein FliO
VSVPAEHFPADETLAAVNAPTDDIAALAPSEPLVTARPSRNSDGCGVVSLATIALGAAAAMVWVAWRRRKARPVETSIEVIASRSLGPKARVVWLVAGDREIVLAVSAQNVQLLSQWQRSGGATAAAARFDVNQQLEDATPPPVAEEPAALPAARVNPPSPALSGLLRLREKGRALEPGMRALDRRNFAPDPEVASGDEEDDAIWARELMAATTRAVGARR